MHRIRSFARIIAANADWAWRANCAGNSANDASGARRQLSSDASGGCGAIGTGAFAGAFGRRGGLACCGGAGVGVAFAAVGGGLGARGAGCGGGGSPVMMLTGGIDAADGKS